MNPTLSMWINIAAAVAGVIAALGVSQVPSYIPPGIAADIVQTCGYAVAIWGGVNAAMHGVSTPQPGPLNPDKK